MVQESHELCQDLLLVWQGALEALHAVLEEGSEVPIEKAINFCVDHGARTKVILELVEHPECFPKYRYILKYDCMYWSRWSQATRSEIRASNCWIFEYLHEIIDEIGHES